MERHVCGRCGHSEIFLRRKGNAVGLYCGNCEKWYQWVGKKALPDYTRRGLKVHPEGYVPPMKHQAQSQVPVQHQPNFGGVQEPYVQDPYQQTYQEPYQPPYQEPYQEPQPDFSKQEGFGELGEEVDYIEPQSTGEELYRQHQQSKPQFGNNMGYSQLEDHEDTDAICTLCNGGIFSPVGESVVTMDIKIVDKECYLRVHSKAQGNIVGRFKIKYCPNCGRKLGN